MAPVAKRNFTRRHDHGQNIGALADSDLEDDMDESERTADKVDESKRQETEASAKRKRDASDLSDDNEERLLANGSTDGGGPRNGNGANVSAKRRAIWSNLLARRPRTKDPRNLSSWLNEVLTVSDLDFPIEQTPEKSKAKKPRKPKKSSLDKSTCACAGS